jgi:hypothetical protein
MDECLASRHATTLTHDLSGGGFRYVQITPRLIAGISSAAKDAAMKLLIDHVDHPEGGHPIPLTIVVVAEKKDCPGANRRPGCITKPWPLAQGVKQLASECLKRATQLVTHPVVGEPEQHIIRRHRPGCGRRHWLWNLRPAPQPHFQGVL